MLISKNVRRPKDSEPRTHRPTPDEIERICLALGFDEQTATTRSQRVAVSFLFAIETAMRAGEICALTKEMIDGRVAHLPSSMTKNGTRRDVPLSKRALDLLDFLRPVGAGKPIFDMPSGSLDALYRKAKMRCQIENLTFHDSRHEAIARLAPRS